MKIELGKQNERLVKQLLKRGRYRSADELVNAGLELVRGLDESEAARLEWMREAIKEGEASARTHGWIPGTPDLVKSIKKEGRARVAALKRRKRA